MFKAKMQLCSGFCIRKRQFFPLLDFDSKQKGREIRFCLMQFIYADYFAFLLFFTRVIKLAMTVTHSDVCDTKMYSVEKINLFFLFKVCFFGRKKL